MSHGPLEQFFVFPLFHFSLFGLDLSLTNLALCMIVAVLLCCFFIFYIFLSPKIIPSKKQISMELVYDMILDMLGSSIGHNAKNFVPLIFSIFLLVLSCNLLGMLPLGIATTSQIIVTFSIAFIVFSTITIVGFFFHGIKFFSLFLPKGCPLYMAPLMILIELFSFLSKPVSLSLRLAANVTSGHILLHIIAIGGVTLFSFSQFCPISPILSSFIGIPITTILIGFEVCVSILQAYIFTILSCVYLSDVINLH